MEWNNAWKAFNDTGKVKICVMRNNDFFKFHKAENLEILPVYIYLKKDNCVSKDFTLTLNKIQICIIKYINLSLLMLNVSIKDIL